MPHVRLDTCAQEVFDALRSEGFSPFFGTPCGILAPLYALLEEGAGLITVGREDSAVGLAAGSVMGGAKPVVLMQNSGFGQSINAVASLIAPYQIPLLLVIGMRGTGADTTPENEVMGRLTEVALTHAGFRFDTLKAGEVAKQSRWSREIVEVAREPVALLVPPALFGWQP